MYTVIRNYKSAPGFADQLKERTKDIEKLITTVPGFIAYYLIKTKDGATSVTVCDGREGCDESSKRAANYIREQMPNVKVGPPEIIEGELAFRTANYQTRV